MDHLTPQQRSKNMAAIRSKDTKPEMIVRHGLWKRGFRYRLNDRRLPRHPEFVTETLSVEQIGVKGGAKGGVKEPNVTKDVTKELTERQLAILEMIIEDSFVTIPEMSLKTGVATRTIKRDIENLQSSGILTRKGGRKDGEWIVTELGLAEGDGTVVWRRYSRHQQASDTYL